jgi:hypothetical protein
VTRKRTSPDGAPPADPVGDLIADTVLDLLPGADVELAYAPAGASPPSLANGSTASATAGGPPGWDMTVLVRPGARIAPLIDAESWFRELLSTVPEAILRAAAALRSNGSHGAQPIGPLLRRSFRDTAAAEVLASYLYARSDGHLATKLIEDTIEFLVELNSTRVEAQDVTHGVVITDLFRDSPRIDVGYPADVKVAKRAPLLFDGQRSVLLVDLDGRARTELQRHRLDRFAKPGAEPVHVDGLGDGGSLVAAATRVVGGLGLYLRPDRSIWTFVDGHPLIVRRSEHWTAFPLPLAESLSRAIGGGKAAQMVADAAFTISGQPRGAILAIVDDAAALEGVVPLKDRYDLRNELDPAAMRIETRLHHLIDADDLDERTLVRLATLDGATILDRDGRLVAYGAVVSSFDSQHEGARTAAARTLSERAQVVAMISVDGDITIFRDGTAIATLLRGATSSVP